MKEVKLVFHDAKEERPTKSGHVLCVTKHGGVQHLEYSKKLDLFNAYDCMEEYEEASKNAIEVDFWADITDVLKELRGTYDGI